MADLSNLLGDVYGEPEPEPAAPSATPAAPTAPAAPAWAADSRLDEAFADWTPEPLERVVAKAPTSAPLDDDLAAALSAALADAPRRPPTGPGAPPVPTFSHVAAVDPPLDPPLLDVATLEPLAPVEPSGLDVVVVEPPVEVPEPKSKRRSFSLGRSARAATSVPGTPEPAWTEPGAAAAAPGWHRSDDDILPVTAKRGRGGRARPRVS
jgi:hypothetical protein